MQIQMQIRMQIHARLAIAKAANCALQNNYRIKNCYKYRYKYWVQIQMQIRMQIRIQIQLQIQKQTQIQIQMQIHARSVIAKAGSAHCKATTLMFPDRAESREVSGLIFDLSCL